MTNSWISRDPSSFISNVNHKIPMKVTRWRWVTVFLASLSLFGGYFCKQITISLSFSLQESLDKNDRLLSLLNGMAIYPNIVFCVIGGLLISKYGISFSILLFSILTAIGHIVFGIPTYLNGEHTYLTYYWLAIGGRIIFGIGFESLVTGLTTLIAKWFGKQEYGFALSLCQMVWRSGTVLGGVLINSLVNLSLQNNILISLIIGVIGFLFGIALSIFERYANYRDLKTKSVLVDEIDTFKWEYIGRLSIIYWIIVIFRSLMYIGLYSFTSNSKDYLINVYEFGEEKSSMLSNMNYGFAIILFPFIGWIIDHKGKRITFCIFSTILMTLSNILYLSLPKENLTFWWIAPSFLLAVSYCIFSIAVNSMIYIVVLTKSIGLAYGISSGVQNFGTSIGTFIISQFFAEDKENDYIFTNIFGMSFSILGFLVSLFLYQYSKKKNFFLDLQGIFNRAMN